MPATRPPLLNPAHPPPGLAPTSEALPLLEQLARAGSWRWGLAPQAPQAKGLKWVSPFSWTPALARLLHWPRPDAPPWRAPWDLLVPARRAALQNLLHQGLRHRTDPGCEADEVIELDSIALCAQGQERPVRLLMHCRLEAGQRVWHAVVQERSEQVQGLAQAARERMQLSTTLASMTEAFVTLDHQGRLNYVNPPACRLLRRPASELLGQHLWRQLDEAAATGLHQELHQALGSEQPSEFEAFAAGLGKWLEFRLYPFDEGLALYLRDVSERHRTQEQLQLLHTCIARLNDVVLIVEQRSAQAPRIVFANEAFSRLSGYSAQEVIGHHPRVLRQAQTDALEWRRITQALRQGQTVRTELLHKRKNGEPFWIELEVVPLEESAQGVRHWVAVGRDISSRKSQEEAIEHLAFHDALTGLPNRQQLLRRLQTALPLMGGRIGALMFIDLDHFKLLNDTLGHDRGDQLLQQVATRLQACMGPGDTVARLGGDEFVVVMHELARRPSQARQRARSAGEVILQALSQPYELAGQSYHGTCSIGVTLLSNHQQSLADLLKQADLAMYQAKSAGRNTLCFFDPRMQAAASAKAALNSALRQGLHRHDFVLHYQPQVGTDGQLVGLEALVRWRHLSALRGPKDFIAQAEESGLILPLGQWVLDESCRQLARWRRHPVLQRLRLSVNVSTRQFLQADFVQQVLSCVSRHDVPAQQIELEITESLLATDLSGTIARMQQLRLAGLSLAIDDFGMGYSALSCLKHMPLQRLKIDRAFVKDMLSDPRDAAIARSIIALAHDLGLQVTAEGVETAAQQALLAAAGCQAFQGFLFSPALPADELEAFVERWPARARLG